MGSSETTLKRWYAVYTRPKSEKKVAVTLTSRGIDTYCPIQKIRKRWHDRFKIIDEPVFRSYVFVHIPDADRTAVLSDPNVLQFVKHCGKPAIIKDDEMSVVRQFLDDYSGCSFTLTDAEENDPVRIEEGLFIDYTGVIVKKSKHKASIRIEMFNAFLVAEFKDTQYSKIQ
jgi:transcription antitermination factor NusG